MLSFTKVGSETWIAHARHGQYAVQRENGGGGPRFFAAYQAKRPGANTRFHGFEPIGKFDTAREALSAAHAHAGFARRGRTG